MYKTELDNTAKALSELEETRSKLLKQIREKDEGKALLIKEKMTADKIYQILAEKAKSYEAQIKQAETIRTQLEEAVKAHDARARQSEELLKKNREETFTVRQLVDKLRTQMALVSVKSQEYQLEHDRLRKAFDTAKEDCAELQSKLSVSQRESKRHQEERDSALQKLNRSAVNDDLQEELNDWKRYALCSQCHTNRKSVVITRCFHCFCKDCIDKNLQVRNRKCPACGDKFNHTDVHQIYL
jgi:E3 ubiquitin-protein ligase BRE1